MDDTANTDRPPSLYVTNLNPRVTGVSATAAAVLSRQANQFDAVLVGHPLPGCPPPIRPFQALRMARHAPPDRPFSIWHVRRNAEMQLALIARDILRLPVRIVFTSSAQRRHSAWPRWLISRMDAVIATTDEAASYLDNVAAVVPHGVDTDRFSPAPDPAAAWALTGYPGAYGIATVGRVRPEKGTDLFVEAMIAALPRLDGATALVVGQARAADKAFLDDLRARVARAGLQQRILFVGEVAPEKLPALLQGCRALVALPRYEGYGVTPLEAMATGLPIVASDTGYFREFVGHEDAAGLVVPLQDHAAAAEGLVAILSDPDRYAAMSAHARRRVTERFGIAAETDAIRAVYQHLWSQD